MNRTGFARACTALLVLLAASSLASAGAIHGWGSNFYGIMSGIPAGNNFVKVSSYEQHGLGLRGDGSVVAWGLGSSELLVPAGTYTDIGAGAATSYAIRTDGSIAAWGYNGYGQLSGAPTSGTFTKISAGRFHATALRSDGTALAWGYSGGTGVGTFIDVSSSMLDWSLGVRNDGTVDGTGTLYAWGSQNAYNQFNVPAGNDFVAASETSWSGDTTTRVSAGRSGICALFSGK